jgi:hypothetical protein
MYTQELLKFTQNQATFNFNNLPYNENYFACLILGLVILAGCQSKQRKLLRSSRNNCGKWLQTKQSKVTNDAATILSKRSPVLS